MHTSPNHFSEVLAGLDSRLSPEARLAVAAFDNAKPNLHSTILQSSSGRELVGGGFTRDIELAAEYSVSDSVPVLEKDHFESR